MKAAVLPGPGQPIETRDDIEVAPPGPGEARVKVVASGICHSDLSVQNGTIPLPTPIVLGHEGAGVVEEVGEGVTKVKPGDHVVLSFVPACGECYTCSKGQPYLCERSAACSTGPPASPAVVPRCTRWHASAPTAPTRSCRRSRW
jgi:S-(hydroxymethyl)glutathione dehydrogenase/alcohol dehydrogenase